MKYYVAMLLRLLISVIAFYSTQGLGKTPAREWTHKYIQGQTQVLEAVVLEPMMHQPTLVLLNGLTYEKESWRSLVQHLAPLGYGLVLYDPAGQGHSLREYPVASHPYAIEAQADDLFLVTQALGLGPKLYLVGLSYGGGLALAFAKRYPEFIQEAFLLAPYTEPVETQEKWIQQQIQWVRLTQPWNSQSDEELYSHYLRLNVFHVFPLAEVAILSHPNKREAVYQMIQGIRNFNMFNASQFLPEQSTHLMIGGLDQYIPRHVLERFWQQLPPSSRATKMVIRLSEHKLPESFPLHTARWIDQILKNKNLWIERTQQRGTLYDDEIDLGSPFRKN